MNKTYFTIYFTLFLIIAAITFIFFPQGVYFLLGMIVSFVGKLWRNKREQKIVKGE